MRERAHQDQIRSLVAGQQLVIIFMVGHPIQDDGRGPGEVYEAPLVVPVLRILFARLPGEFCRAEPMLEGLSRITDAFTGLVSELIDGGRAILPLCARIPNLSLLPVGMRVPTVSSRTGLTGGVGISGAGASDLSGAWETMTVAGGRRLVVLWLRRLWRLLVRLGSKLVVVIGGVDVWGVCCAHVVGDIDQSDWVDSGLLRWLR